MSSLVNLFRNLRRKPARPQRTVDERVRDIRALVERCEYSAARVLAESLVEEAPDSADAVHMLGLAAYGLSDASTAFDCFSRAIALFPDEPVLHNNLGSVLNLLGQPAEARSSFRKALALDPSLHAARANLIYTVIMLADESPESICAEHIAWAEMHAEPLKAQILPFDNVPESGRRLRIGYVSADFRVHALTIFMDPVFDYYDRNRFEVYCYYNNAYRSSDEMTESIRRRIYGFREITDLDDDAAASLIRSDGIDILVDLSGHLRNNRLLLFARKPAPVQMTYLAYPGTTGMSTVDYRITDALSDPPGKNDHHYREKLLRIPGCLWCFRPPTGMPEVSVLPALRNGHVTFGCTNAIIKVTDRMLTLWAQILHAVPNSRLVFATVPPRGRERVIKILTENGIGEERFRMVDRLPRDQFWALYGDIDIMLDTFPCNGGTTTCEALWLGVPAITLVGNAFQSRAGYSLLTGIGLGEFVADSEADYVKKAVVLAADLKQLGQIRESLRARMTAAPLLDGPGFTRNLETLYRDAWRSWCLSVKSGPESASRSS